MKLLYALLLSLLMALAACTPNQGDDDATTDPVTQPSATARPDEGDDGDDDDGGDDDDDGSPDATGSPSNTPSESPSN